MQIVPGDVGKAQRAFDALAQGGKVTMPFAPPFWGGHFGMLTDRFGVPWMVSSGHWARRPRRTGALWQDEKNCAPAQEHSRVAAALRPSIGATTRRPLPCP